MLTASKDTSKARELPGLRSHLLLGRDDGPGVDLSVTWVDIEPGAGQVPHDHEPQQVYVVVAGTGRMRVGENERDLSPGSLAFIPPNTTHGITNTGDEVLSYVSAATPTFDIEAIYENAQAGNPA